MRRLFALIVGLGLLLASGGVRAADAPAAMPQMTGWFERTINQLEAEAASDISMAPDVWSALAREWRSFDRDGSASWVLVDLAWVAAAALVALLVERLVIYLAGWRLRRRMRAREEGPRLAEMLGLVAADLAGLVAFYAAFTTLQRRFLPGVGVTEVLSLFSANVLIRWRGAAVVVRAILRPADPVARLVEISDGETRRLSRFLSAAILAIIILVVFGRYGLADEDSGAPHIIGLINAVLVCGVYVLILFRARGAAEALIRGRRRGGIVAAVHNGLARAWLPIGLVLVAGLFVFFVAGLSLGLLTYYQAAVSTLGIIFVAIVLDRLTERVWHDSEALKQGIRALRARTVHRIMRAIGLAITAAALAFTWTTAIEMSDAAAAAAMGSVGAAIGTIFVAFIVWELVRLAIDRHLQEVSAGPSLPGLFGDDEEASPASRLQTILPLLRAGFAALIGVLAALIVLSRLGVDTAPLIAGAGVFGLAISFGSQSLVRDIISGLFYMWDDAFRVGEYIDTGRLKGTVEMLGIRSVKLRHQNGPLHTIPYGQLGAVTNLSRDYATIKFNLRLEPGTDIELVRKTAKQIGLAMQDDHPELAAEIILPLKLQGLAEIADNALVLRFKFTARPVKPSWVQREYLKRMVQAFAEKGIKFAKGAVMIQTVPPVDALPAETSASAPPPARPASRARRAKPAPAAGPAPVSDAAK
jgi:moderate conductance mechanosensitive channel